MQNNKDMLKYFKKNNVYNEDFKLRFVLIPLIFVSYSLYYDLAILNQTLYQNGYIFFKSFFLLFPFILYFLNLKQSRRSIFYYSLYWVFYSFYHVKYVSLIYNTAFIQTAVAFSIMVVLTGIEFIVFSLLMIVSSTYSILTTEMVMSYVINNQAAKTDILINSICLQGLCYLVYYYMTLPKLKITESEKKLAKFGKTSSFIMHEMEKPLKRINQDPSSIQDELKKIQEVFQVSKILSSNSNEIIEIQEINLNVEVNKVIERYRGLIDALSIQIDSRLSNEIIKTNSKYFGLILDNLLRNAIEEVKYNTDKNITLEFKDNILSIYNVFQNKILSYEDIGQPMKTTKVGHMGVGLFICKTLSEKIGHQINFKLKDNFFCVELVVSID